ncbi:MAG: DUF4251 domain-containing protein [Bacteroidota bacterium]|nr:DUF4251 domain-containing protein [Bacteroidota bacterium]MDP4204383.1 DUF4251 domain-containing protein [Bacteroidota bacterium]
MKKSALIFMCLTFFSIHMLSGIGWAQTIHKSGSSRQAEKVAAVKKMIEGKRFIFEAQQASPMGGPTINLTSSYNLSVTNDTIEAFLPYFGRAYSAPLNEDSGIKFKSLKFEYTSTLLKKGGWNIKISPLDTRRHYILFLNVSQHGYATLNVQDDMRQSISFNGIISEKEPK